MLRKIIRVIQVIFITVAVTLYSFIDYESDRKFVRIEVKSTIFMYLFPAFNICRLFSRIKTQARYLYTHTFLIVRGNPLMLILSETLISKK